MQIYALVIAAFLGLSAFSWAQHQQLKVARNEASSLRAQVAGAEKSRREAVKAAGKRAQEAHRAQEAAKESRAALDRALQGPARDWEATQVPKEVLDAL
jgi:hypothetical protein